MSDTGLILVLLWLIGTGFLFVIQVATLACLAFVAWEGQGRNDKLESLGLQIVELRGELRMRRQGDVRNVLSSGSGATSQGGAAASHGGIAQAPGPEY